MDDMESKRDRLALHLDVRLSEVEEASWDHYGLDVFKVGDQEWAVGYDDEANDAREQWTEQNLATMDAGILAGHLNFYRDTVEAIQSHVSEREANEDLLIMVENITTLTDLADDVERGVLATYDDNEVDLGQDEDGSDLYGYRLN
jgi:hypothetical protein